MITAFECTAAHYRRELHPSTNAYLPLGKMGRKKTEICSLFLCLWLLTAADSFEVFEPSEPINVRDDEALELTCTGSNPWLYCKWSFYEKDCARFESRKHF